LEFPAEFSDLSAASLPFHKHGAPLVEVLFFASGPADIAGLIADVIIDSVDGEIFSRPIPNFRHHITTEDFIDPPPLRNSHAPGAVILE
jgi:hypothetical protein